jgi:hypothetical protein
VARVSCTPAMIKRLQPVHALSYPDKIYYQDRVERHRDSSSTGRFNEAVKRNIEGFPEDIMCCASSPPWAFTEHGPIQAAEVLHSSRAIAMGVYISRVQLRDLLASNKDLARRLDQLEARLDIKLTTHDEAIAAILSAIRQVKIPPARPPATKRSGIGFTAEIDEKP